MKLVILPKSATNNQKNLKSLPKAGIVYVLYFPVSGWEHGAGRLCCGPAKVWSLPPVIPVSVIPDPSTEPSAGHLQSCKTQTTELTQRPFEVTHCICWKADMISLGKY